MTLLAERRCHCERRFSDSSERPSKACGMRLIVLRDALVCACCDLGTERRER